MNRERIIRSGIHIIISFVVLLVILVGAGVVYTWWIGQNDIKSNSVVIDSAESTKPSIIKPTKPAANAKLGVAIQMLTTPVVPGLNASVTAKTNTDSKCSIQVLYNEVASRDSGLTPKIADDYGMVSWTWTVESNVPLGKWPVKIACALGSKSAVVVGDLVVAREVN